MGSGMCGIFPPASPPLLAFMTSLLLPYFSWITTAHGHPYPKTLPPSFHLHCRPELTPSQSNSYPSHHALPSPLAPLLTFSPFASDSLSYFLLPHRLPLSLFLLPASLYPPTSLSPSPPPLLSPSHVEQLPLHSDTEACITSKAPAVSWGIDKDKWYYVKFHLMTNF